MEKLMGKVAIITGAGSGIGRAITLLFAREGAKVVAADVDEAGLQETVRLVTGAGGTAIAVRTDVSKAVDVQGMVSAALDNWGRPDILINNAGIEGQQAPTADCTEENWDRVINVNLKGVFLGMKHAIPHMLSNGGGAIINVASVAGLVGFAGIPAYCASKGGVIQLSKAAALEYAGQGVRVNAICPGVVWTPMVERFISGNPEMREALIALEPVGRFGTPEEVAALALYLASDEAAFVTGASFAIDGGFVAR